MTETFPAIRPWLEAAEARLGEMRARYEAGGEEDPAVRALLREFPGAPHAAEGLLPPDIRLDPEQRVDVRIQTHVLRARLGMSAAQAERPLPLPRLLELAGILCDHLAAQESSLEPLWTAWLQYSRGRAGHVPESAPASSAPLREFLLGGDPEGLRRALARHRRAARFSLAFQAAVKSAGAAFARELANELDPAAISAAARAGKPRPGAEALWRTYEERADRLTPREVEGRLTRQIIDAVEKLFDEHPTS